MSDAEFSGRLLSGERVLWSERPAAGLLVTGRDAFLIPFSIIWCAFVVFWTFGAASAGGTFALFGLPFVVFGLFFSIGRFVLDAWIRGGMRYAVTDRRILILKTRPSNNFTAVDLDRLPQIEVSERSNGRGTLRFGASTSLFAAGRTGFSVWMPSLDPTPQFIAIPAARQVFDLIQRRTHDA
jgi:hypothetical protein